MNKLMIASVVGLVSTPVYALTDLEIAGVYYADRNMCNLYVEDSWVQNSLANAVVQYDIKPSEAIQRAANIARAIELNMNEAGKVQEYCKARMKR